MTDAQFDILASLLRMTSEPIKAAARLVLVNGERQADAARAAKCLPNNLARAVMLLQDTHAQLKKVYEKA